MICGRICGQVKKSFKLEGKYKAGGAREGKEEEHTTILGDVKGRPQEKGKTAGKTTLLSPFPTIFCPA